MTSAQPFIVAFTFPASILLQLGAFADPYKINIEVASANGIATAEALAKLFGILANGGKAGNKTLLSKRILDAYADDRRGPTPDLLMYDLPIRWKWAMDVIPQGTNVSIDRVAIFVT